MRSLTIPVLVLAMILTACGGADTAQTTAPTDTPAAASTDDPAGAPTEAETEEAATADDASVVTVTSSDLGDILTDGEGNTLYLFLPDEQGASTCYDDCETNWPPLEGPAEATGSADAGLLGSVERDDGTEQVTYNDWPLYYFAADSAPGDVEGQGVGDVWFVVDPAGGPVEEMADRDDAARDY